MTEELQKKAENFIIDRYKLAECYREDNSETREYMRMDVHSQYEEEYQLYLDATKELQKENAELKSRNAELKGMYAHSAREAETYKQFLESKEKENAELRNRNQELLKSCEGATMMYKDLCKAKELLEELYDCIPASSADYYKKTLQKVADFLKDSEVEK